MCLITRFPKIITKKDLVVYKILDDNLKSPFVEFPYKLNTLAISDLRGHSVYKQTLNFFETTCIFSDSFPQYIEPYIEYYRIFDVSPAKVIKIDFGSLPNNYFSVGVGLHSFRTVIDAFMYRQILLNYPRFKIYKAIVPAGSALYINHKQIVSNQLVIKNVIEEP